MPSKNKKRKQATATRHAVVRAKIKAAKRKDRGESKGETLIAFLLDETGSMGPRSAEAVEGFNNYVRKMREEHAKGQRSRLWLRVFSSIRTADLRNKVRIDNVAPLAEEYKPDGMTPLYDAVWRFIADVSKDGHPGNIVMVILTDGEENVSREFTQKQVAALVKEKQEEGWNFIYLGANQDAWSTGAHMGFNRGQTMNYDPKDYLGTYAVAAAGTAASMAQTAGLRRQSVTLDATLEWKKQDEERDRKEKLRKGQ